MARRAGTVRGGDNEWNSSAEKARSPARSSGVRHSSSGPAVRYRARILRNRSGSSVPHSRTVRSRSGQLSPAAVCPHSRRLPVLHRTGSSARRSAVRCSILQTVSADRSRTVRVLPHSVHSSVLPDTAQEARQQPAARSRADGHPFLSRPAAMPCSFCS